MPDFYSGATGPPGRFSAGFSLRRLHFCRALDLNELRRYGILAPRHDGPAIGAGSSGHDPADDRWARDHGAEKADDLDDPVALALGILETA